MKLSIRKTLLSLILLATGSTNSLMAQSWQKTTLNFAQDTVVQSATVCDYDNAGTTYFAGAWYDIVNFDDGFYLWKVNASGTVTGKVKLTTNSTLWTAFSVRSVKYIGGAIYVAVDARYQTGTFDYDAFIMKFSTGLVKQWEKFQNRVGDPNDYGVALEAGPNSSVIFTGNTGTLGFINKYSRTDGTVLASNLIDPSGGLGSATVSKLIVNGSNIFVGGNYTQTTTNIYVQKYDAALVKKWSNIFDPSGTAANSYLYDMTLDTAGNPGVCGYFQYTGSINRAFITKYSKSTGNTPWTKKVAIDYTEAKGLALDAAGNFVCVMSGSPFPRFMKLNTTTGASVLSKSIFNNPQVHFVPVKLCKGAGGANYVIGNYDSTYNPGTGWIYHQGVCITRLNDAGNRDWNKILISTRPDWTRTPGDFAVYNNTSVIYSVNEQDLSLIPKEFYVTYGKFNAVTGLREEGNALSMTIEGLNIYPNPATDQINFTVPVTESESVIEVLDASGRLVLSEKAVLVQENNSINIAGLAKGYYILKIISQDSIKTEKFIKD